MSLLPQPEKTEQASLRSSLNKSLNARSVQPSSRTERRRSSEPAILMRNYASSEKVRREEDLQGKPFVGRSRQLLTDMIEKGWGSSATRSSSATSCDADRRRIEIPKSKKQTTADLSSTRPSASSNQSSSAVWAPSPRQICSKRTSLSESYGGIVHDYNGVKVVCTYHPAYLLRNPSAKNRPGTISNCSCGKWAANPRKITSIN